MGLELTKELATGAVATYWKIASISTHINRVYTSNLFMAPMFMDGFEVVLLGYVDKLKRDDNKDNIIQENIRFEVPMNMNLTSDLRAYAYSQIKLMSEWSNAIDC
jgi:hypothetical protein